MDLPKRFSNKRPALKTLISRVLRGSEGHGPFSRHSERRDARGPVARNPAKSQTRLTSERREQLVADYESGMPVRAIAAKHGVHRGSIPKIARAAGVPLRASGLSETARARALALYDEGFTLQEVSDRRDADDKTVRNAIVALGGRIRPRGRRTNVDA